MRPVPISPEVILEHNTASENYKYLAGIDHFRSYVKTSLTEVLMK